MLKPIAGMVTLVMVVCVALGLSLSRNEVFQPYSGPATGRRLDAETNWINTREQQSAQHEAATQSEAERHTSVVNRAWENFATGISTAVPTVVEVGTAALFLSAAGALFMSVLGNLMMRHSRMRRAHLVVDRDRELQYLREARDITVQLQSLVPVQIASLNAITAAPAVQPQPVPQAQPTALPVSLQQVAGSVLVAALPKRKPVSRICNLPHI